MIYEESAGIILLLIFTQRERMLIPLPSSFHLETSPLRAIILNVKNKNLNLKVKIKNLFENIIIQPKKPNKMNSD